MQNFFYCLLFLLMISDGMTRLPITGNRYEVLTGLGSRGKNSNNLEHKPDPYADLAPSWFLAENYHYIRSGGKVLDIRLNNGRNAIFLAKKGFKVSGFEVDRENIKKANLFAKEYNTRINIINKTVYTYRGKKGVLDAIVCFNFVNRSLIHRFMKWLKSGGILIMGGHTVLHKNTKELGVVSSGYLLGQGELLKLFNKYHVLKYEEPLHLKEYTSSIIVQKK